MLFQKENVLHNMSTTKGNQIGNPSIAQLGDPLGPSFSAVILLALGSFLPPVLLYPLLLFYVFSGSIFSPSSLFSDSDLHQSQPLLLSIFSRSSSRAPFHFQLQLLLTA